MPKVTRRTFVGLTVAAGVAATASRKVSAEASHGRVIKIEARPAPISIDPAQAALVVVDMQNDFGAEGGMFHRAGIDISGIKKVVAPTARAIDVARRGGFRKIVYLKMAYRPDLSDLGPPDSANNARHQRLGEGKEIEAPDGSASRILVRDTWNTEILDALKPQPEDLVLYKTRFSGFYGTDLHERLQALSVKYLVFTGCTTSICVESTGRDAMFRDYVCVLLEDCMSEPIGDGLARSNHDASLLSVEVLLGWVSDSQRFERAFQA